MVNLALTGGIDTPIDVQIDTERCLVAARLKGSLTVSAVREYLSSTWASGDLKGYCELLDLREIELENFNFGHILDLAMEAPAMGGREKPARLAMVVKSTEQFDKAQIFGAAREFLRPGADVFQVFTSIDDAKKWLDESSTPLH